MKDAKSRNFIAAIDLDGTLLDSTAAVGPENRAALDELVRRGYEVVLASGRHPVDMAGIAARLPMVRWLVGCQGCEVVSADRKQVLSRVGLPAGVAVRVAEAGHRAGFAVIGYTADAEIAPWDHPEIRRYESVSKTRVEVQTPETFATAPLLKIVWVGETARIDELVTSGAAQDVAAGLDTVRSHDLVFEFMPPDVTKATGVAQVAALLGIPRERVVAFGDADNDMPLFGWAGRSVAMPHARPHVQAAATMVAPAGPADSAFARAVAILAEPEPAHRVTGIDG